MAEGNLGDFLKIFKNLISHEEMLREDILLAIQKNTGIEIDKKNLQIKNSVGILSCHPALKNEIVLKKKVIMDSLRESTRKKISDIC